ncbi:hypothetical protein RMATCC62417_12730 [Rhizopus microsporus]|nr:hypothetical protein RMATCC62417_12730 [Rhizopus microsporus]
MVSAILSEGPQFRPEFKYGVEFKKTTTSEEVKENQTVVKLAAAAFNHRDIWILTGNYAGTVLNSVLGSDGVGHIIKNGKIGQRVLVNPAIGWKSDPRKPEKTLHILGLLPAIGTLTEEPVVVDQEDVVPCPEHLSLAEAAALPLAGLTAYRTLFTKGQVQKGQHVLITGIGGGVALFALQFAAAIGAHVYVTSSSEEKIQKAIRLGAKGGINYRNENCIKELEKLLDGNKLSAIIDGAGGPLHSKYLDVLYEGGIIVNYGQTVRDGGILYSVEHFIQNVEIRGSTMGSRAEFKEMVQFVDKHKIKPVVSHVWKGLNKSSFEEAVVTMHGGNQFGKLVIEF